MIDFIEYVVAELKSKRLSKSNAAALVRQFSRASSSSAAAECIHPLLHRNLSDLSEQRYDSTFTGNEFFLSDHRVAANGQAAHRVLPGVAYLEMARAAIEQAMPERPESALLELHNTVWAQPIVVTGKKQVRIALLANAENQIDYEIYSDNAGQEILHCQGRAVLQPKAAPDKLDIGQLKGQMGQATLEPGSVYAAFARMGLIYGPAFQGITAIYRGTKQVLAELRLPGAVRDTERDYVLHPSLMDGALQSAVGLIDGLADLANQPPLPFALDTLRILAPCTSEMVAWVRCSPGSEPADKVIKLDIDLCDESGDLCVQMHGFSSRVLNSEIDQPSGSLAATPVWEPSVLTSPGLGHTDEYTEHHVILCELSKINAGTLESVTPGSRCVSVQADQQKTVAERYTDNALACFEEIQAILKEIQVKPGSKLLVQIVVNGDHEHVLLSGLSGLLRTAALESSRFTGQLIALPADIRLEELGHLLQAEKTSGSDPLIRYQQGTRQVLRWQEVAAQPEKSGVALKDDGVYLITGGLGSLGVLFAKEILERTTQARVVLTGRGTVTGQKQAILDGLSAQVGRVSYRQVDLGDLDHLKQLIGEIQEEYGGLNGILHSAGMITDNLILRKSSAEFRQVLEPKVTGTFNLDQASRDLELDFFVLFSSIASPFGNLGQADYATANGFMDQFAVYRNRLATAKQRYGATRSINWPLWQAGGMAIDAAIQERLRRTTGIQPMQTATGLQAFYRSLALPCDRLLVVEGDLREMRRALLEGPGAPAMRVESQSEPESEQLAVAAAMDAESLVEKTQQYLRRQFSELLKVPSQKIDPRAALENYGIDSILAVKLTNQLETAFGSLSKTLFFEYQTVRDLAGYFIAHYPAQLNALFARTVNRPAEAVPPAAESVSAAPAKLATSRRASRRRSAAPSAATTDDRIAIIGLSGRYAEAVNIEVYWENLRDAKDCITEVPKERWNWREYFSDDRSKSGHHYSKWGGFIAGVDEFDPLFFNISPVDAGHIDPQERLFLQHVWMAVEDAGYTRASLQAPCDQDLPGQVGVYAGVMYTEYQLFGAEAIARGRRLGVPGSAASIANRVSYALNLHGPSMTLDTMCSSSLTAIHLACEDLKHKRISLGIAGGVNVSIHPNKYLVLSDGQFISSDGHCQSFGEGGDGYIPGEGVGVVILKRLSEAKKDGDHIYGIIRGSALTHGGKTNGYSVPNPQAQTSAIARALAQSQTDARHISYIEAHGTGTRLGDPIEIAALSKAFHQHTQDTGFCLIGSAKSNVGHCESAAGIAGLTKVLLQMQHQEIVPSLHSAQLNPHIDFLRTPFVVNQTLRRWEQPLIDGRRIPRIAGISSFGAGGSNAHMIVEEYQETAQEPTVAFPVAIVLSARTVEQLRQKASDLLDFVRPRLHTVDLAAMAYTLQVGREAMEQRLGFMLSSAEDLVEKLTAYVAGQQSIEDAYQGQVKRNNETLSLFSTDVDLQQAIDRWIAGRKVSKLLELWVKGLELDWSRLYGEGRPRRLSLPTYPFARERYWTDAAVSAQVAANCAATAVLHPLLHRNTSDLSEQRYSATFTGDEFFLADHQIKASGNASQKVLPGVAYLEMARTAVEQALPELPKSAVLELRNTVWAQPIVVAGSKEVGIALLAGDDEQIDYEIRTREADQEIVHCQGRAVWSREPAPARLDIAQLKAGLEYLAPDDIYAACARMGLVYGPSFQTITAVHRGKGQLLAELRRPCTVVDDSTDYVLHPSLMDGALQAAAGLIEGAESTRPRLPFALEMLRILSPCTPEMVAWVRYAPESRAADNVVKLDIDLCDEQGNVCVQMRGFSSRAVSTEIDPAAGNLFATPFWQNSVAASSGASNIEYTEHRVIVCELSTVSVETLESVVQGSRCLSLQSDQDKTIAGRYSDYAVACFKQVQAILQHKAAGKLLVQIVIADHQEQVVLAGLWGLLKTASLENPLFTGQLILVPAGTTAEQLGRHLQAEKGGGLDSLIRYEQDTRQVRGWQEVATAREKAPLAFKENGVYLITGGLGGLGVLFAKEILERTREGRVVLAGRGALTEQKQAVIDGLSAQPGRVSYQQVDLGDLGQVQRLIAAVSEQYHQLNGILHSAGMIADNFILKKTAAEFSEVLEPKVTGTFNLDQASRDVELDFFVLFSSVAGALGNPGQADYATANSFMDQFAGYRNRQVAAKERHGRTRSINWPLWQAGGMTIDPASRELLQQITGMRPMRTETGMEAFHRSLALPYDQTLVVEGDVTKIRRALLAGAAVPAEREGEQPAIAAAIDPHSFTEKTQDYLRKEFSELLRLPSHKIDPQAALEEYGIDSILAMKLTNQLEKTFGSLPKTLFFEYQTIHELSAYFIEHHSSQLTALLAPPANPRGEAAPAASGPISPAPTRRISNRRFSRFRDAAPSATTDDDWIAIVGLSGRYPGAVNIEAYWDNLREGKDCITEVPRERWNWRQYFSDDRSQGGHHYSKWGGFMAGVDEFDPLFFNISPVDAELMDPQERLFLQHAWMAMEDAGYCRASLQVRSEQDLAGQVGVYAGVMYSEYQLFGAEASAQGKRLALPGSTASIANRVSYVLNLHGPSLTLDTMCSSSLTAIHFACQDLKLKRTSLAIAGGVNVTIHPNKYLVLSAGQFISGDGHCQSFGEGGDGYIPGEGVGVVVLKRLSEAKRDGDHIYGIIRGSALNHGGKTNGYTVPNPQAQATAISRALAESHTDARHISYIEAHGTGTKLGDPIEIAALSKAFRHYTRDSEFCLIGSAKSNIGHCESAAGIAGLTKVLLQMQYRQIVPSLHSARLNPGIDFPSTPFVVNQSLRSWEQPVIDGRKVPRIAGISSFGAGGSNAHMIIEEYQPPVQQPTAVSTAVIVLSARTAEQLRQKVGDLLDFVRARDTVDLAAMAYTLHVGREAMEERLGFVVDSVETLAEKLRAYVDGDQRIEDTYQGQVKRNTEALSVFSMDADLRQTVDRWLANGKLSKLLDLWVKGMEVDWSKLYLESKPRRLSLPAYPFAKERYWIDATAGVQVDAKGAAIAVLHPLVHRNTSDLSEQRYSTTFTGEEFFLVDHQVQLDGRARQKVLPGVACLEMARAAVEQALPKGAGPGVLELRHTVWAQPIVVVDRKQVSIALTANENEQVDYEIYSQEGDREIVHCQGCAVWSREAAPVRLDVEQLKGEMGQGRLEREDVYAACARMGLVYGPALQAITAIHRGDNQVVAQLRLPGTVADNSRDYVLHPSLMDGALQACVGLLEDSTGRSGRPRLPFALERLRVLAPWTPELVAWVRYAPGSGPTDKVVKLDIDLSDERGNVCVQMHGFSSRAVGPQSGPASGSLLATPVWQDRVAVSGASGKEYTEHHVILCELAQVRVEALGFGVASSRCLSLQSEPQKTIAERYSDAAKACFERIQVILKGRPEGPVLVQIVVSDHPDSALLAGLAGLLKTAALENPQLRGQLLLVPAGIMAEELGRYLQAEKNSGEEALIRYEQGTRQVRGWQEVAAERDQTPLTSKDDGVYLITGGLGGLGVVFAKQILEQTREGRVVLTGRGALTERQQAVLEGLSAAGRVAYRQLDLVDRDQVQQVIAAIVAEYGQLNGILHSAGMKADNFILKKNGAEFSAVLAPKVTGTFNLDQASRDVKLDFFVLFSSLAGALGNLGQADYAAANGFMDQFAAYRNRQVAAQERHGRTRSINWPLWQAGGMGIDTAAQERLHHTTGMQPMQTATGLEAFHHSLTLPDDQMLVVEGDLALLRRALFAGPALPAQPQTQPVDAAALDAQSLTEQTQDYLRRQFSALLKLPFHKIDPRAALENYGIDSILAMKLTNQLETTFGSLSKTLFFEYQTIADLARYFVKAYPAVVRDNIGLPHQEPKTKDPDQTTIEKRRPAAAAWMKKRFLSPKTEYPNEIAIVGLGGRYPQAENLLEFWRNLQAGRDCITEVPPERWDHKLYYDPDPTKRGKSYSKWGGFIADVDKFDTLFFNISPKEAELIDPQERLFLETAWQTIEDAGYTKESISGSRVGVFVGVMWGQYELYGAEAVLRGNPSLPGSSHSSIANRVSYFFDFHGPSIALDTMCSSSLTAIHLACDALWKGDIDAAIAGGVNLTIHPYKYLGLSQGKFAASDGRCRSFGAGGDGYVPGEGVGAVLLKPLQKALRDGDQIYAVIRSSTINHGGKTNGYTVPNPNAQGDLIRDALQKANIDPKTLSYVETHGTGTSLGDPIEITGLSKAFEGSTHEKQFCPIGSVKSNIGHLESAAGIAAVTKALLQIRHKQLVPSLHADPLNPNINFKESPFYVQTELTEWKRPAAHPRRVGVSSFGAGGSNAHLILEEYADAWEPENASEAKPLEAFVISARDLSALRRYAEKVVNFLENVSDVSLANMAYTSQVGRTPMDARLVVIASSVEELRLKLNQWIDLPNNEDVNRAGNITELEDVFYGNLKDGKYSAGDLIEGPAGKAFLEALLANRELEKIARLWILGVDMDWTLMYRHTGPRRVSLPTYPFARERYWISQEAPSPGVTPDNAPETIETAAHEQAEEKRRAYYFPQWTLKGLARQEEKRRAPDSDDSDNSNSSNAPVLILDTSKKLFLRLKQRPQNGPADVSLVLLKPGTPFEELEPSIYVIDPEHEEQFNELVANLKNRGVLPGVVLHHSWDTCNLEIAREVAEQLNNGLSPLFYLCRALMREEHQVPVKIMSVFSTHSEAAAPLAAALGGFLKTVTLEDSRYLAKVVGIHSEPGSDEESALSLKADLIWDEIYDKDWTAREIRYSADKNKQGLARYISELIPHRNAGKPLSPLPLRQKGVYLITGGLGGLGFIMAEYLAKKFQAKLVLVGRSLPGARQEERLNRLKGCGAEILFLRADVSNLEDMKMVVREAKTQFSEIHGVIHCAGVNRDAFILRKTTEEIEAVLAPKVYGAINVDLATSGESLDIFVLFSSLAGVTGNIGQGDYAYANHFLDFFAEYRESLRKAKKRSGRALSIDWPLWEEGGMGVSRSDIGLLEERTGICPLPTQEGIQCCEDFLRSTATQAVALYGIPSRIAACIAQPAAPAYESISAPTGSVDRAVLFANTEAYLKTLIGDEIKLASDRIGSSDRLESFGIDSVMINQINARLERDLGALPKTLLYEHETVLDLATFLIQSMRQPLIALFGLESTPELRREKPERSPDGSGVVQENNSLDPHQPGAFLEASPYRARASQHSSSSGEGGVEEIAIIGMHGYYPHSTNLDEYWNNLKEGRDLIDLVPSSRWDHEEFYDPDPTAAADGKIYCKWGGFLGDYDKFDPHFFKISSAEAKLTDPQERLFLESVWAAIEDAGYTRDRLRTRFPKGGSADVGVFVGVTTNSYHLWAPEERTRGNFASPTALPWSIANRVSYFFDFSGPSLPIDTACSSSLVAIHLACENLRNRECQVAIAGGVNLYLHPAKYQSLCQRRMLSLNGKCHSYGAGDDGFIPGEGVGTLVLKPLSKAIEDHDRIHAVIRASGFDHSGRSNGYSAPNPNAQASLITHVLKKANVHPQTIGYVEGHGTGTQLGDSIEIAALTQAFQKQTTEKQFCPIGSVKANIGHSESAAGIAGLAKVILQMRHRQLAPSIHSDEPNPNIEFKDSPFYLQHGLSEWASSSLHPRRALINSFGAGGVNACLIVEEYEKPESPNGVPESRSYVFTLSARNEDRLREYVDRLINRLRGEPGIDLASLCYTLQVGREAMEERLATVVSEVTELIDRLGDWSERGSAANVYRGSLGSSRGSKRSSKAAEGAIREPSLTELASRWASGEAVDWVRLYSGRAPRPLSLPSYPFARERYWVSDSLIPEKPAPSSAQLHPLIACNSSTFKEVRFTSLLSDTAFYAVDHKVHQERIFPGAGFLEMACISANVAGERRVSKVKDIVWVHPLSFRTGAQAVQTVLNHVGDSVEYVISSFDDENETMVHSEGRVVLGNGWLDPADAGDRMPLQALKAQCPEPEEGVAFYDKFREYGLHYGPSFQTVQELYVNASFALSRLKIPDCLKNDFDQFILHPSMIDGALQTAAGLLGNEAPRTPCLPFALDEVEMIRPVPQTCYVYVECADASKRNHTGAAKYNIRLLSESGEVLVKFNNLYLRPLASPLTSSHSLVVAESLA